MTIPMKTSTIFRADDKFLKEHTRKPPKEMACWLPKARKQLILEHKFFGSLIHRLDSPVAPEMENHSA